MAALVDFKYHDKVVTVECNKDDKMQDICEKFAKQEGVDINKVDFLFLEKDLNKELTFDETSKLKPGEEKPPEAPQPPEAPKPPEAPQPPEAPKPPEAPQPPEAPKPPEEKKDGAYVKLVGSVVKGLGTGGS